MKTIGLNDQAYEVLRHLKEPGESFSDVVMRLSGASWLLRFAGTMDAEAADVMDQVIAERDHADDRDGWLWD